LGVIGMGDKLFYLWRSKIKKHRTKPNNTDFGKTSYWF